MAWLPWYACNMVWILWKTALFFLFCGTRRDRIKGLIYEEGGWLLLYFRLSRGSVFQWPHSSDEAKAITQEQYEHLLDGFSLESSIHKDTGQTTGMKSK